jgi:hypothetical protein
LAGAQLPTGVMLDSHSFAPQVRGEAGSPRKWLYMELNGKSYARNARFKLTNDGELFDLIDAPFKEILVAKDTTDPMAIASRNSLQSVLDEHPAAPGKFNATQTIKRFVKRL